MGYTTPKDNPLLTHWIGAGIISNWNLLFSLFTPLKIHIPLVLFILILYLAKTDHKPNRDLLRSIPFPILAAAFLASQNSSWSDTLFYHTPLINILSEYGILFGTGLINMPMGNTASWFALWAPWNDGILAGRIDSLPGAYCFFIWMITAAFHTKMFIKNRDVNHVKVITLILGSITLINQYDGPTMFASSTPDLAAQSIWICVFISLIQKDYKNMILCVFLVVLAIPLRISVIPALIIPLILHLKWHRTIPPKSMIIVLSATLIIGGLSGWKASGCAYFPLPWFCLNTSYSLRHTGALSMTNHIIENAKYLHLHSSKPTSFLGWLPTWIENEAGGGTALTLWILGSIALLFLKEKSYIKMYSILSGFFILCTAPAIRYGGSLFFFPLAAIFALKSVRTLWSLWFLWAITFCIQNDTFSTTFHRLYHSNDIPPKTLDIFLKSSEYFSQKEWQKSYLINDFLCKKLPDWKDACLDREIALSKMDLNIDPRLKSKMEQYVEQAYTPKRKLHSLWIRYSAGIFKRSCYF